MQFTQEFPIFYIYIGAFPGGYTTFPAGFAFPLPSFKGFVYIFPICIIDIAPPDLDIEAIYLFGYPSIYWDS